MGPTVLYSLRLNGLDVDRKDCLHLPNPVIRLTDTSFVGA